MLEQKYEVLMLMVNGKAEYSSLKTLEESYMRLNEAKNMCFLNQKCAERNGHITRQL